MKLFTYKGTKVYLQAEQYAKGGTLAVAMYKQDGELFNVITTNLMDPMQSDSMAYLDENNCTGIGKWLERRGLAFPMYVSTRSGFCTYPLYTIFTSLF